MIAIDLLSYHTKALKTTKTNEKQMNGEEQKF